MATVHLTINGKKVKAGEETTLLEVCRKMAISIPSLCSHPDLEPHGSCRLCTVEVSENGKTRMVTACNYPAREGIRVQTHSDRVLRARRVLVELLLARCPRVPLIQDLAREMGILKSPYTTENPGNDCILCGLCVRTCNEIVGAHAIGFSKRGTRRRIGTPFEIQSDSCIACGACEYICPTGAVKMEMERIRKIRRSDTGMLRSCRYMRLGLIDFMVCSNGFECWRCEVDQGMEDRFGTHPAFALKPAQGKRPFLVNGFTFYPEYLYGKDHVWVKSVGAPVRIGLDDLASQLARKAESIHLPPVGASLKKDRVLMELRAGGKKVEIRSPLTGKVSVINRDVEASPDLAWRDPYRRGWLLMIEPRHPEEISRLSSGEKAKTWFGQEAENLASLFKKWMPDPSAGEDPFTNPSSRRVLYDRWEQAAETLLKGMGLALSPREVRDVIR